MPNAAKDLLFDPSTPHIPDLTLTSDFASIPIRARLQECRNTSLAAPLGADSKSPP